MMMLNIANFASKIASGGGKPFAQLLKIFNRIIFACDIGLGAKVPKSCTFLHARLGVVIHEKAILGENCTIFPNVIIGGSGRIGEGDIAPVIGDNVMICSGAVVIGNVKIGNGSIIAANAVVLSDVPENVMVAGVPAHIKKKLEG